MITRILTAIYWHYLLQREYTLAEIMGDLK